MHDQTSLPPDDEDVLEGVREPEEQLPREEEENRGDDGPEPGPRPVHLGPDRGMVTRDLEGRGVAQAAVARGHRDRL